MTSSDTDGTSPEELDLEDPSDDDDERRCDGEDIGLRNLCRSEHFAGEDLPDGIAETGAFFDAFA
jgi:hypothetical protein